MALKSDQRTWETFLRRPGDLREGAEIPLVLRDLNPGRDKYAMRHVVAVVSRKPEDMENMDLLHVRTVVGVRLPETWGVKILRDLPMELPGKPYHDFYEALKKAATSESSAPR